MICSIGSRCENHHNKRSIAWGPIEFGIFCTNDPGSSRQEIFFAVQNLTFVPAALPNSSSIGSSKFVLHKQKHELNEEKYGFHMWPCSQRAGSITICMCIRNCNASPGLAHNLWLSVSGAGSTASSSESPGRFNFSLIRNQVSVFQGVCFKNNKLRSKRFLILNPRSLLLPKNVFLKKRHLNPKDS